VVSMFVLNGQASKGVEILQKYGLTQYESKAYFSLLVLGETNVCNLVRKSGVPQSKMYWTLERLLNRGLVATTQAFPRKFVALPFETYLTECIKEKREEIGRLLEGKKQFRELVCKLQPIGLKYADKLKVFEPSYKRGLGSFRLNQHA